MTLTAAEYANLISKNKTSSPWNIAADFDVDMSLSEKGIAEMLAKYEADHHTDMDIPLIAKLLYDYISGYPFLVSRLCKLMDEKVSGNSLKNLHGQSRDF